ncbi:MAG: hypothetical protein ACI8RD_006540 [Bacillariaceae sp.]|jgi:hypothetical protein
MDIIVDKGIGKKKKKNGTSIKSKPKESKK